MFYFQAAFLMQATWYVSRVTCPGVTCRECDAKTSFKHSHPRHHPEYSGKKCPEKVLFIIKPTAAARRRSACTSDCIFQLAGQSRHIQTWEQCLTMFPSTLIRIFDIQSFKELSFNPNLFGTLVCKTFINGFDQQWFRKLIFHTYVPIYDEGDFSVSTDSLGLIDFKHCLTKLTCLGTSFEHCV